MEGLGSVYDDRVLKAAVDAIPVTAMRGTDDAALASVAGALDTAAATGAVSNAKAIMAYLKQLVTQNVSCMTFTSAPVAIVVIPGTGADLDFPSVVVAGIPTGATLLRVDMAVVIGSVFDTSGFENQIKVGTSDEIRAMKSGASWGSDDVQALVFAALGLQVDADAYRGGTVLFGGIDIKSEVDGNGTYLFRSEETTRTKGVEATAVTIELLDVQTVVRVWFN